jgi:hypothetical protein
MQQRRLDKVPFGNRFIKRQYHPYVYSVGEWGLRVGFERRREPGSRGRS